MKNGNHYDTATYLVQNFIGSHKAYELGLDPYDLIILFTIARYLDMPLKKCFGKQITLAKDCHMSIRQFKYRSEELHKDGFILRYKKGKLYHYELGSLLTGISDEFEGAQYALVSSMNRGAKMT